MKNSIKKQMMVSIYLALIIFTSFSCEKDNEGISVETNFQLLDINGNPSTDFNQNENFVFSFEIHNTSSEIIYFQGMDTKEFMKVYLISSVESTDPVPIGKPYKNMFCTYQNGYPIAGNSTLKIELPWSPPEPWEPGTKYYNTIFCGINKNEALSKGIYKSEFNTDLYFTLNNEEYIIPNKSYKLNFEIK